MQADLFKDVLVPVIGGLGIFMLGLEFMSNGIQALAVNKMRALLASIAGTPIKGLMAGTFITGVIQSSTAMTVMTVGLVNAGVMGLRPAISVIMGANIGTTLGNGLIALPLGPLGLILGGVFALVYVFAQDRQGPQHRARLHGLLADLLRPQPDDRRPAPAAQHAGGDVGDQRAEGRQLHQPDLVRADRRLHHRDDPLVLGDDRHRDGPRRRRHARLADRGRVLARRRPRHHHHLVDGVAQPVEERQTRGLRAHNVQHHRRRGDAAALLRVHGAAGLGHGLVRRRSRRGGDRQRQGNLPAGAGRGRPLFDGVQHLQHRVDVPVHQRVLRVLSKVGHTSVEDREDYSMPRYPQAGRPEGPRDRRRRGAAGERPLSGGRRRSSWRSHAARRTRPTTSPRTTTSSTC